MVRMVTTTGAMGTSTSWRAALNGVHGRCLVTDPDVLALRSWMREPSVLEPFVADSGSLA